MPVVFMIRTANDDDLHAIAKLHVLSWQTAYKGVVPDELLASRDEERSLSGWRSTMRSYPENLSVALSNDGVLIGFCCSGPAVDMERNGSFDFEIYGLHVNPSLHRRGIGTALLTNSFDRMVSLCLHGAIVWTFESLVQSRRFYEKHGGKEIRTAICDISGYKLNEVAYGWETGSRT